MRLGVGGRRTKNLSVTSYIRAVAILICALVYYEALLPTSLPPTHSGRAFRFSYKLILGFQKLLGKTEVCHVAFRLFHHLNGRFRLMSLAMDFTKLMPLEDGSSPVYDHRHIIALDKADIVVQEIPREPNIGAKTATWWV